LDLQHILRWQNRGTDITINKLEYCNINCWDKRIMVNRKPAILIIFQRR